MAQRTAITATVKEYGDPIALLHQMETTFRGKALTDSLKKAGKPVVARAKALAPKSALTGTTEKLSISAKAKRKHPAKPLAETITQVARDYGDTKVLVVGPSYPAGAHGHLVEFGHEAVYWGDVKLRKSDEEKQTTHKRRVPPKPFLRPASESTKSQQTAAFIGELQRHIEKASR